MHETINFLTAKQVAEMLNISLATLHGLCQKRAQGNVHASPSFYQIGHKRMFREQDVHAWLKDQVR